MTVTSVTRKLATYTLTGFQGNP